MLEYMWNELIKGERHSNHLVNLGGFLFFSIGSLYVYKYDNQLDKLIFILVVMTCVDYFFMTVWPALYQREFEAGIRKNEQDQWIYFSEAYDISESFDSTYVKRLVIREITEKHGIIFDQEVSVWQLLMVEDHGSEARVLYEANDPFDVQSMAAWVSREINLVCPQVDHVNFTSKRSAGTYGKLSRELDLHKNDQGFSVEKKLKGRSLWNLVKDVFDQSGHVLFLLILATITVRIGKFLSFFYGSYFGVQRPDDFVMDFRNLFSTFKVFIPEIKTSDMIEIGLLFITLVCVIISQIKNQKLVVVNGVCYGKNGGKTFEAPLNDIDFSFVPGNKIDILLHRGENEFYLHNFCDQHDLEKIFSMIAHFRDSKQQQSENVVTLDVDLGVSRKSKLKLAPKKESTVNLVPYLSINTDVEERKRTLKHVERITAYSQVFDCHFCGEENALKAPECWSCGTEY